MTTVYDIAVANGFDADFIYEHNLAEVGTLTLTGGGDAIVSIDNTEGDGTDAQQATPGREPRYDQAVLNGIKVATFQDGGTVQNLDILGPKQAALNGVTAFSIFGVIRVESIISTNGRIWSNEKLGTPNGINFQEQNALTGPRIARCQVDFIGDANENADFPNTYKDQWIQFTIQWSVARGAMILRIGQTLIQTNLTGGTAVESGITTSSYGKRSNTVSSNIAAYDLAHFAVIKQDLGVVDRDAIESLMKQTWFIPPVTSIAKLAMDIHLGPAISALTEIGPAFKMDTVVGPAFKAAAIFNPERFSP